MKKVEQNFQLANKVRKRVGIVFVEDSMTQIQEMLSFFRFHNRSSGRLRENRIIGPFSSAGNEPSESNLLRRLGVLFRTQSFDIALLMSRVAVLIDFAGLQRDRLIADCTKRMLGLGLTENSIERWHRNSWNFFGITQPYNPGRPAQAPKSAINAQ